MAKHEATGTVAQVLVGQTKGTLVTTVETTIRITPEGVEGDLHAGLSRASDSRTPWYKRGLPIHNTRQVSLIAAEEMAELAAALGLPEVLPAWLGANIMVQGIADFSHLPPASRIFFPDRTVLFVTEQNFPCVQPGRVLQEQFADEPGLAQRFVKAALHLRGIVALVEHPGTVSAGDAVRVAVAEQIPYRGLVPVS